MAFCVGSVAMYRGEKVEVVKSSLTPRGQAPRISVKAIAGSRKSGREQFTVSADSLVTVDEWERRHPNEDPEMAD